MAAPKEVPTVSPKQTEAVKPATAPALPLPQPQPQSVANPAHQVQPTMQAGVLADPVPVRVQAKQAVETKHPEPAKQKEPEQVKHEPAKQEKPEPVKHEPAKQEAVKQESVKQEVIPPEPAKQESAEEVRARVDNRSTDEYLADLFVRASSKEAEKMTETGDPN